MKRILPLLMLGLIGCSSAPVGKETTASSAASPQATIASSQTPSQTTSQKSPQTPQVSPSPLVNLDESVLTPPAVEPAKTEPQQQAKVARDKAVAKNEPVDDPAARTARLEIARAMDQQAKTVLRNQNWTITVGGTWSGVNGEGNLSYEGCDASGQCLSLKGGTVSCRDGICSQGWRNGDYSYSLSAPIAEVGEPTSSSTLRVYQGDKLILAETGLKAES
jgi:hypothetical protein